MGTISAATAYVHNQSWVGRNALRRMGQRFKTT